MISETETPQDAKSVFPGKSARHAQADPSRYFTQSPQCWFYYEMAQLCKAELTDEVKLIYFYHPDKRKWLKLHLKMCPFFHEISSLDVWC